MRKSIAAALLTGSLLTGGAIGTALLGGSVASAQSSSDTQSSQSTDSGSSSNSATPPGGPQDHHRGPGGPIDPTVAANTIGISVDDLKAAVDSGQSLADVATAHNVDPQAVIDALVADAKAKLADRVTSGEITQAQADQMSTDLVQHITDHVNRAGGPGGAGCPGMGGPDSSADQGSSSNSSGS
jgi:hypothetical protein